MPIPFNLLKPYVKDSLARKATWWLIAVLAAVLVVHYLVFRIFIPKTAVFGIPQKWRMVPLRQSRTIARAYFGEPLPGPLPGNSDTWVAGTKNRSYVLRLYYVNDTIAASYSVHYRYDQWFGSRDYVIDTGTIR